MWILSLLSLVARPAQAIELDLTPRELCAAADHVVLARVTHQRVFWGADGWIYTETQFVVGWDFTGTPLGAFTLLLPGGELDGQRLIVSDVPRFEVGHRYVLPLTEGPGDGVHLTWAAGVVPADGLPEDTAALARLEVCDAR